MILDKHTIYFGYYKLCFISLFLRFKDSFVSVKKFFFYEKVDIIAKKYTLSQKNFFL